MEKTDTTKEKILHFQYFLSLPVFANFQDSTSKQLTLKDSGCNDKKEHLIKHYQNGNKNILKRSVAGLLNLG